MTTKVFVCICCEKEFTPPYRIPNAKVPLTCSKQCAGSHRKGLIHKKEDLETKVIDLIKSAGRYLVKEELCNGLKISSKTLTKFKVSVAACNKAAGMKKPQSMTETIVGIELDKIFGRVTRQKVFEGCVSPKGFPLRYDFFIEDRNVLVEVDGKHHTDSTSWWNTEYTAECDRIKNEYAKAHNLYLIRMPYSRTVDLSYVISHLSEAYKATTWPETAGVNA
jgi:very-short-patch-repair endonuclease